MIVVMLISFLFYLIVRFSPLWMKISWLLLSFFDYNLAFDIFICKFKTVLFIKLSFSVNNRLTLF
jgi:hypothetical protein